MSGSAIEKGLWISTFVLIGITAIELIRPLPRAMTVGVPVISSLAPRRPFEPGALDSARALTVASDPFRISHQPPLMAKTPEPVLPMENPAPIGPPRPQLRLKGIIGPPWEAVIEGMPERASAVLVRSGDVIAELQIRRITRDSVVIADADTVWILKMERHSQ